MNFLPSNTDQVMIILARNSQWYQSLSKAAGKGISMRPTANSCHTEEVPSIRGDEIPITRSSAVRKGKQASRADTPKWHVASILGLPLLQGLE